MHSQSSRRCGVECGRVMCMTKKWVFGYCNFLRLNRTTRTLAYMVVIMCTTYTTYWCMRHPRSALCSSEDWQKWKVKILLAAVVLLFIYRGNIGDGGMLDTAIDHFANMDLSCDPAIDLNYWGSIIRCLRDASGSCLHEPMRVHHSLDNFINWTSGRVVKALDCCCWGRLTTEWSVVQFLAAWKTFVFWLFFCFFFCFLFLFVHAPA